MKSPIFFRGDLSKCRLWLFVALLVLCFAGGGASRNDVSSLLYLQPLTVLLSAAIFLVPAPVDLARYKVPLILLAALAGLMIFQLIPLPPSVWLSLPGRSDYAEAALAVGVSQPFRPISLTPDRTVGALAGLLVPLGVILGYAAIDPKDRAILPVAVLSGLTVSAVLAVAQLAAGPSSPLYLYQITNADSGVGLLANRNHQAAFLAMGFPLLAWFAFREGPLRRDMRLYLCGAFALFLLPMILVTGSRVGLVAAAMSIVATLIVFRKELWSRHASDRRRKLLLALVILSVALIVGIAIALSRAQAFDRMFLSGVADDVRFRGLPVFFALVVDHFPVGAGFGSFEDLFKAYEPHAMLRFAYLNHAHNDFLEFLIDGGLGALFILLAFLAWLLRSFIRLARAKREGLRGTRLGSVGGIVVFILLAASLFDYPLRTPLMAAIMALAVCWLCDVGHAAQQRRTP